jgi:hypothetical protein
MEENTPNKSKFYEKMDIYFDAPTTSSNYKEEQTKEKLQLRKNKIFNLLFTKRKELITNDNENTINDCRKIDIKSLNCEEEIKNDPVKYIKTKFDIKTWFKYFFSSNKNDNLVSLFLIRKYIELQMEIKEDKRRLSRNDTELIQRLCDNLLNDDIKIIYNSCVSLTNLTLFPKHIEDRIYSEKNLEKILKFFNVLSNNIAMLKYDSLFLFVNICFNNNVKIYFVKHSFLDNLYNFINNIINKNININEKLELNTIRLCINILSELITICQIDDNYINRFLPFIQICKIITTKYYANIDNLIFDESQAYNLITMWKYYTMERKDREKIINEIIKDNFTKILILIYYKIKQIEIKEEMIKIFCDLLSINENVDAILINDGIIKFYADEIERYQYSNVFFLTNIILGISNLAMGNIGENNLLFESQIISKIIDITSFHIDDKLDEEIIDLLVICIQCLANFVNGCTSETKINILNYKKLSIISIFCKALKLEIEIKEKKRLNKKLIYAINELNVASEELDTDLESEYDIILIKNSVKEVLINYNEKSHLEEGLKEAIERIVEFINDKEKDI